MSINQQDAAKYLLHLRRAEESFEGFVRLLHPDWKLPPFHKDLIGALDLLERNELTNLYGKDKRFSGLPEEKKVRNILITMPPRHGKSTYGSVYFPAYFMSRKPSRFMMVTSYNTQLAMDFGRQVRSVVNDKKNEQAFPDFQMSPDSRSVEAWRTTVGGAAFFVGVGGTTSGRAANLLLFDDPLKSREEAESATQRNKIWNYYTSALTTRLQPDIDNVPPAQIVILTRWHPDDLAGRLMQTEDWNEGRWLHINYPAIKDVETGLSIMRNQLPKDDPRYLPTAENNRLSNSKRLVKATKEEALWPERFNLSDLHRRQRLNPREFASLYQQTPYIEGGNLIKANWWRSYPSDLKPESFSFLIIAADTAFKKTDTSDYSVMIVAGLDRTGDIYIVDLIRERYEFPDLKRRMIQLNNQWRGRGLRGIYVEDRASGQSLIQELQRESGVSVIPYKISNDKVARLNAVLPLIEGGRVLLPAMASWLDTFHEECQSFPSGTYDDQIDALAIALDVLARTPSGGDYYRPPTFDRHKETFWDMKSELNTGSTWSGWGE